MPDDYSAYPNGLALFQGAMVYENGESWLMMSRALPWWPDEPIYKWMIPGTYK